MQQGNCSFYMSLRVKPGLPPRPASQYVWQAATLSWVLKLDCMANPHCAWKQTGGYSGTCTNK